MPLTTQIITAARECVGVPFHHQGRNAKTGLDCIGLIAQALRGAGVEVKDRVDYARQPKPEELFSALEAHGFEVAADIEAGDVLVFRFGRQPQHVALAVSATRMIHAYAPLGRVVEAGIGESWMRRLSRVYRLKVTGDA